MNTQRESEISNVNVNTNVYAQPKNEMKENFCITYNK